MNSPNQQFDPIKRARTILRLLWQEYDTGGHSMGRSKKSMLLELALKLMGPPDPIESEIADDDAYSLIKEAEDYLWEKFKKEFDKPFDAPNSLYK